MDFLLNNPIVNLLYAPLLNILVLLCQYLPGRDFGIAVIVLTIGIRLFLYPLTAQSIKLQKTQVELQPKIQEIQRKYKDDKKKQMRAIIEFYQKEKFNPLGGCFPLIIQFSILLGLFKVFMVFKDGLAPTELTILYPFVSAANLSEVPTFLGLINLAQPNLILAFLAGICQFFQTKMITPGQKIGGGQTSAEKQDQMAQFSNLIQKQMLYFSPIFMVFILLKLPSAIGLYWTVTALFSIGQQYLIFKKPS